MHTMHVLDLAQPGKMAAEFAKRKRRNPDENLCSDSHPNQVAASRTGRRETPFVQIVQGYLSRVQRSLESVKRRSSALAEAWSLRSFKS